MLLIAYYVFSPSIPDYTWGELQNIPKKDLKEVSWYLFFVCKLVLSNVLLTTHYSLLANFIGGDSVLFFGMTASSVIDLYSIIGKFLYLKNFSITVGGLLYYFFTFLNVFLQINVLFYKDQSETPIQKIIEQSILTVCIIFCIF